MTTKYRPGAGPKIPVVEDCLEIVTLLQVKLQGAGFEVRVEVDGLSGLSAARQGGYAVVILDKNLPGLGGLEVCRRLRNKIERPGAPRLLHAMRGVGYMLRENAPGAG